MSSELLNHDNSTFYDEHNNIIPHQNLEREEQLDVFTFLNKDSNVLELGARYGTVSCLINRILTNKENHVAVEPDTTVIEALTKNRDNQGCKFHIFNGIVSKKPVSLIPFGYSSMTIPSESESDVPIISLNQLQEKHSLKFDVIVADCEGCMCQFVEENDMSQFKSIFLEKDQCHMCDYEKVEAHLSSLGFLRIHNHLNIVFRSVYINMNFLPFNILSYEVSHGTIGVFGKLGYTSENISDVIIDEQNIYPLSAHAPSKILINTKVPFQIRGYCSTTSQQCPKLSFKCNDNFLGYVTKSGNGTGYFELNPGKYELTVETSTLHWAHSVWIFKPIKRYLKIDPITIERGLCNQLMSFVHSLMLSHASKRDIYDPKFRIDYRSETLIPLSSIIDMNFLNELMSSLGINCRIVFDKYLEKISWNLHPYRGWLWGTSRRLEYHCTNIDMDPNTYLDIACGLELTMNMADEMKNLEINIFKNMRVTSEYNEVFEYCVQNYLVSGYKAVHLRLEDDWLDHLMSVTGIYNIEYHSGIICENYLKAINEKFSPDDTIFIATYLTRSKNRNTWIIDKIRERFPKVTLALPWREKFNLPIGREIDAFIDYMICINAEFLIGINGSTFSIVTTDIVRAKGKPVFLVPTTGQFSP